MDRRTSGVISGLLAGLAIALSIPPFGWWWSAFAGLALLCKAAETEPVRERALVGAAAGFGWFAVSLFWVTDFHVTGLLLLLIIETAFIVFACIAYRPNHRMSFVIAIALAEFARANVPFGGIPLGGISLGQVNGPLMHFARVAGPIGVCLSTAAAGVAVESLWSQRWRRGSTYAFALGAAVVLAMSMPDGTSTGHTSRIAAIQGGGERGIRAVDADESVVFRRHLRQASVPRDADLILWPENTVAVEGPLKGSPEAQAIADLARAERSNVIAGVTETVGSRRFRNAAVHWTREGFIKDRYEKVHRVPFGEYVPLRSALERVVDLSVLPRDAIPGKGANTIDTETKFGVAISFEVFFPSRTREAVRHDAEILLVPTNAASYRTSQVPTQEVAAAQLRAVETGRNLVQAAPTGYTAFVNHRGRVLMRSSLGKPAVLSREVEAREGHTIYVWLGEIPFVVGSLVLLIISRSDWRPRGLFPERLK